jgi:hypothetical protein
LIWGLRETVEHPAVDSTVTLTQSLVDDSDQDVVRDFEASFKGLLDLGFDSWVYLALSLDQLMR